MILDVGHLRALAELKRKQVALTEAQAAYLGAEAACRRIGISHRQIAAITGPRPRQLRLTEASVYRRGKAIPPGAAPPEPLRD